MCNIVFYNHPEEAVGRKKNRKRRRSSEQKQKQTVDVQGTLQRATALHNKGDLRNAEILYRTVLQIDFNNFDALHLLGVIAYQAGKYEQAESLIRKAISKRPWVPACYLNLGNVLFARERFEDALRAFETAAEIDPNYADAHFNCGNTLKKFGLLDRSIECFQTVLKLEPGYFKAYYNIGNALREKGNIADARRYYEKSLSLNPQYAPAHNNLGNILREEGDLCRSLEHYQAALNINNDYADAHFNAAVIMKQQDRTREAIHHMNQTVRLLPDNIDIRRKYATLLKNAGGCEAARLQYMEVLRLDPAASDALNNMGSILKDQGKLEEAFEHFEKALAVDPEFVNAHSNILLDYHYHAHLDDTFLFEEHLRRAKELQRCDKPSAATPAKGVRTAERLRVGYISPDFCRHSVAYFMEPMLECHDHDNFEIFCYSDVKKDREDTYTVTMKHYADSWRDIQGMAHQEVYNLIGNDGIDILIDLAGHTAHNRLPVFAAKAAPVQISAIGYPNTTGLPEMDYRLTDSCADPEGDSDTMHAERLVRLDPCFLCYKPMDVCPEAGTLPCLQSGHITFGSFNNIAKVNPEVVALWCRIMHEVPGSKILLKAASLGDMATRKRYIDMFRDRGISHDRVELQPLSSEPFDHMNMYNRVDIGLDPFPYNGTATTCEALCMGVPVITLRGNRHSARVGSTLLSVTGMQDMIAGSPGEYVKKASTLADDMDTLKNYRVSLRKQVAGSPLCDAVSYTRRIESAYKEMWLMYCNNNRNKATAA